jgi:integration host factor subunit beta
MVLTVGGRWKAGPEMVLPFLYTLQSSCEQTTMKKSDLMDALAEKEGLQNKEASDIVNLVFDGFTDTLKKGSRIEIRGFGSFTVRHYDSYTGRNPKTGKRIRVGDKRLPFFKVGKELKERVNSR